MTDIPSVVFILRDKYLKEVAAVGFPAIPFAAHQTFFRLGYVIEIACKVWDGPNTIGTAPRFYSNDAKRCEVFCVNISPTKPSANLLVHIGVIHRSGFANHRVNRGGEGGGVGAS